MVDSESGCRRMDDPPPKKGKRRNSEKRKERSRNAARFRRKEEAEIFTDLAGCLPVPCCIISNLDKATIMRLAISYLRVHNLAETLLNRQQENNMCTVNVVDSSFLSALNGFLLVLSSNGDMVYLSENVHRILGIKKIDMLGQSIFEYSHPCDHDDIREMLALKPQAASPPKAVPTESSPQPELTRSFFIRMKCTLTSKGKNINLKTAAYKVIHCSGKLLYSQQSIPEPEKSKPSRAVTVKSVVCQVISESAGDDTSDSSELSVSHCLILLAEPIPHPENIDTPLYRETFLSQHSLDMKYTYVDKKSTFFEILEYSPADLVGKPFYNFFHASDIDAVSKCFVTLFAKGQCETRPYRYLAKHGGFAWILTQATVIYDKSSRQQQHKPLYVVCVSYLLSGVENSSQILSESQLTCQVEKASTFGCAKPTAEQPSEKTTTVECGPLPTTNDGSPISVDLDSDSVPPPLEIVPDDEEEQLAQHLRFNKPVNSLYQKLPEILTPSHSTNKVFAPLTEGMNKGYLHLAGDSELTVLKEEPTDLTLYAPYPGEACIQLTADPDFLEDVLRSGESIIDSSFISDLKRLNQDLPLSVYTRDGVDCDEDLELGTDLNNSGHIRSRNPTQSTTGVNGNKTTNGLLSASRTANTGITNHEAFVSTTYNSVTGDKNNGQKQNRKHSSSKGLGPRCSVSTLTTLRKVDDLMKEQSLKQSLTTSLASNNNGQDDEFANRAPFIPMEDYLIEEGSTFTFCDDVMWSPGRDNIPQYDEPLTATDIKSVADPLLKNRDIENCNTLKKCTADVLRSNLKDTTPSTKTLCSPQTTRKKCIDLHGYSSRKLQNGGLKTLPPMSRSACQPLEILNCSSGPITPAPVSPPSKKAKVGAKKDALGISTMDDNNPKLESSVLFKLLVDGHDSYREQQHYLPGKNGQLSSAGLVLRKEKNPECQIEGKIPSHIQDISPSPSPEPGLPLSSVPASNNMPLHLCTGVANTHLRSSNQPIPSVWSTETKNQPSYINVPNQQREYETRPTFFPEAVIMSLLTTHTSNTFPVTACRIEYNTDSDKPLLYIPKTKSAAPIVDGMLPHPTLIHITQQDAEVNAPIQNSQGLLQGHELLRALEQHSGD